MEMAVAKVPGTAVLEVVVGEEELILDLLSLDGVNQRGVQCQEEEQVEDPRKLWLGSFRHVSSRTGEEPTLE